MYNKPQWYNYIIVRIPCSASLTKPKDTERGIRIYYNSPH